MPLTKAIEQAELIADLLNNAVERFIKRNEAFILSLNVDQLDKGKTSKNKTISPKYAKTTIKIKKRKGQQTSPPNLKDTGNHRKSLFIKYLKDGFEINDDYGLVGRKLKKKYGVDILGLSEQSINQVNKKIKTFIENELKAI